MERFISDTRQILRSEEGLNARITPLTISPATGGEVLGKTSKQRYKLTLPKVKFSSGEVVAGSTNEYVMCNMGFQALYEAGTGGTVKIERAVA